MSYTYEIIVPIDENTASRHVKTYEHRLELCPFCFKTIYEASGICNQCGTAWIDKTDESEEEAAPPSLLTCPTCSEQELENIRVVFWVSGLDDLVRLEDGSYSVQFHRSISADDLFLETYKVEEHNGFVTLNCKNCGTEWPQKLGLQAP